MFDDIPKSFPPNYVIFRYFQYTYLITKISRNKPFDWVNTLSTRKIKNSLFQICKREAKVREKENKERQEK